MNKYRVAVAGLGPRGRVHIEGFLQNPDRFELAALCDMDEARLAQAVTDYAAPATYTDAEEMLAQTRPDVFCFATQPNVRLSLVELAAKYELKGLAFEKPMATSLREAWAINDLCRKHKIKAVICHQHKYLTSLQQMKQILEAGDIGPVVKIQATTFPWLAHLGTHYMDYIIWANGGAKARWVVGHVHGKEKLADSHPSADYVMGQVLFENGVRAYIECGYLSPRHMKDEIFWVDNRLTIHGTHGYVWADTNGRWGTFNRATNGEMITGVGDSWLKQSKERLQPLYLRDLADWLDDDSRVHPSNVDLAYHGYEILEGLCLSALNHTRVDLPLDTTTWVDVNERLRQELPDLAPLEA